MSMQSYDFSGHRVVVTGGTRGTGHAVARAFVESGAEVVVTGTMMLPELYDADLGGMTYEMVNLARQDSIDHFVRSIGELDVLVNAAGCNLPYGLPPSEASFIAEAARTGVLGPVFLTTRLRLRLGQSQVPGGGAVVNTGALRRWFELSTRPDAAYDDLVEVTRRCGEQYAGIGTRVNSVVEPASTRVPRQAYAPTLRDRAARAGSGDGSGDLMVRSTPTVSESVTETVLFLASRGAARITGQTLRLS